MKFRLICANSILACAALCAHAGDFSQFRGSNGCGVVPDQPIPLRWSAGENLAWKTTIPGSGWSQPIVVGDRLYLTTAVADRQLRPKSFSEGVKSPQSMGITLFSKAPKFDVQWQVFCLSTRDGSVLWKQIVDSGKPRFPIHPSNTFATESPVADEQGVYVYFGASGTVAGLTPKGDFKWKQSVGVFKTSNNFGTGSSLAIHNGKVFLQNLSEGSAEVHCFNAQTGDVVWKASREATATSWSTPLVWENEQRVELIVSGGRQVDSFDPATGEKLWTLRNVKAATACSPCADRSRLYFGGSDPFSKGPLFAVSSGANGDISPDTRNSSFVNCAWLQDRAGPGMASPVSSGQFVYVVDSSVLRCYDARTGQSVYKKRLPKMRMVAASPLIVGSKVLLLGENGTACLVSVGADFEVIGGGELNDTFWATPAVADGAIFLRGVDSLYCVRSTAP